MKTIQVHRLHQASTADGAMFETEPAAAMRRRLRARCPILQDGAGICGRQPASGNRFPRSLLLQATAAMRAEAAPAAQTPTAMSVTAPALRATQFSPSRLRRVTRDIDARSSRGLYQAYEHAHVALIEVAPRKLYCHWSVPDALLTGLRLRLGSAADGSRLVLRFYDVTGIVFDGGNALHTFDLDVERGQRERYVELWSPDRGYILEIGLLTGDGRFHALARSRRAHAPREEPVEGGVRQQLVVEANRLPPSPPAMPVRFRVESPLTLVNAGDDDWPLRDLEAERSVRHAYLCFLREGPRALADLQPPARRPEAVLRAEYEGRRRRRRSQARGRNRQASSCPPRNARAFSTRLDTSAPLAYRSPDLLFPPLAQADTCPVPPLPAIPRYTGGAPQALALLAAVRNVVIPATTLARPDILALPAPAPRLALPRPPRTTTPAASAKPAGTKRLRLQHPGNLARTLAAAGLELKAELILRGRVQPGKKVRIGDRVIETEPDGSFCVSCILHDGRLHVPVEVVEAQVVMARQEVSVSLGGEAPGRG